MAKKKLHEESYQRAVDLARKFPSRIPEIREVFSRLRRESQLAFEVQKDLYGLLLATPDPGKQGEILNAYQQGLDDVEREGRLKLEQVWRVDFAGEWVFDTQIDGAYGQIVAITRPESESKSSRSGSVYCLRIADGSQVWIYRMKKNWAPWQSCLGQHRLFFSGDYCGDRDSSDSQHPLYAVSLETGKLAWKWSLGKHGEVKQVRGLFGDLVLVNGIGWGTDVGDILVALNTKTGEERWCYPSHLHIGGELFLPLENVLCLQYRDREIGWFSQSGKLLKKMALRFPKKDKGFIDLAYADEDTIYICVWDSWRDWDKGTPIEVFSATSETATVVYAIGKDDRKVKWSLRPKVPDVRFEAILPQGKTLYLCSKNATLVVDRETGEIVKEWPFQVLHVSGRLIFRSSRKSRFSDDPFTFFACSARTGKVRWERKNFEFLGAKNRLLFGKVGDALVILDEKTGKERASFGLPEPRGVQFVTKGSFLVKSRESLRLFKLGGEV